MSEEARSQPTSEEKGAAVRFPPPFVPLIALLVGLGLDRLLPLPLDLGAGAARFGFGGALTVVGVVLMGLAFGLFRKTGQDPKPWEPSPELIAEGIYRWTRNPMYLAMGLLQAGLALLLGSLWGVVLVPVSCWVIAVIAIRHEEAYLRERFGDAYEAYCRSVRRWL